MSHYFFTYGDTAKEYLCYFILSEHFPKSPKFSLTKNGIINPILSFDYISNITPYNLGKKLPTILTFC